MLFALMCPLNKRIVTNQLLHPLFQHFHESSFFRNNLLLPFSTFEISSPVWRMRGEYPSHQRRQVMMMQLPNTSVHVQIIPRANCPDLLLFHQNFPCDFTMLIGCGSKLLVEEKSRKLDLLFHLAKSKDYVKTFLYLNILYLSLPVNELSKSDEISKLWHILFAIDSLLKYLKFVSKRSEKRVPEIILFLRHFTNLEITSTKFGY